MYFSSKACIVGAESCHVFPGSILGTADELTNTIRIDVDAAGFGWAKTSASGNATTDGGVDLLWTVVHEFGHLLGYEHDVLDESLDVGERDLPLVPVLGDANADGVFDRLDIVRVLQAGKYRTGQAAAWNEDFNRDGRFDQQDLMAALRTGQYDRHELDDRDAVFAEVGDDEEDFGRIV